MRISAGISYFISMLALAIFYFCVRVKNWPMNNVENNWYSKNMYIAAE